MAHERSFAPGSFVMDSLLRPPMLSRRGAADDAGDERPSPRRLAAPLGVGVLDQTAPQRRSGTTSQSCQQGIVLGVRAYPEPDDRVAVSKADGSPVEADANGVNRLPRVNPLEL